MYFSPREETERILRDVWTIMAVILLIAEILLALFLEGGPTRWSVWKGGILIGLALGCLLGMFLFWDMNRSVERCLDLEGDRAKKFIFSSYVKRLVIIFAAMALASLTRGWVNVIAALGGIFCLKPAVYLQPWFRKNLEKG